MVLFQKMLTILYEVYLIFLSFFNTIKAIPLNETSTIEWDIVEDSPINEVTFTLRNRDGVVEIFNKTTGFLHFRKDKRTKVLIHGFDETPKTAFSIPTLRESILKVCDCNVIEVDWGKWAVKPFYLEAAKNTQPVGRAVGEFLLASHSNLSTTELIGYSLGSHVAGKAGSIVGSKLSRIIGLDPALPLFSDASPKYRLDPSDAYIVEVVHTTAGTLGFAEPIGLRDFYANGGYHPQPGCGELDLVCSHRRSFRYYSEAIRSKGRGFKATLCSSYNDFLNKSCKGKVTYLALANRNVDKTCEGTFYFDTNSQKPFGKYKVPVNDSISNNFTE